MGAGLTTKQEYSAKRSGIQGMAKTLTKAGVKLSVKGLEIWGGAENNARFVVTYGKTLRASNGECFGNTLITIHHPLIGEETYSLLETQIGLNRIMALFGDAEHQKMLKDVWLQWTAIKIERAFYASHDRHHGPAQPGGWYDSDRLGDKNAAVFLYDANGNIVPNKRIFAYNEYKNGKIMVRLGNVLGRAEYVEFLPGMTVRDEKGTILVEYPKAAL